MINVKEALQDFLAKGVVLIALDSNVEGVVLPKHLMNMIQVKLNLSHSFKNNIFEIDEKNVTVDLSFGGVRFVCVIPLQSIYYIANIDDELNGLEISENVPIELFELSESIEREEEARKAKDSNAPSIKIEDVEDRVSKAFEDRRKRARKSKSIREAEDEALKKMVGYYREQDAKKQSSSTSKKTIPGPNISGPNRSMIDNKRLSNQTRQSSIVHHGGKRGKGDTEQ